MRHLFKAELSISPQVLLMINLTVMCIKTYVLTKPITKFCCIVHLSLQNLPNFCYDRFVGSTGYELRALSTRTLGFMLHCRNVQSAVTSVTWMRGNVFLAWWVNGSLRSDIRAPNSLPNSLWNTFLMNYCSRKWKQGKEKSATRWYLCYPSRNVISCKYGDACVG